MKPSLQVRLSQHLALTPQLQQSIRLLQLSTLELHQEVEQMLEQNPFLEAEEDTAPAFEPLAERADDRRARGERETETRRPSRRRRRATRRAGVDSAEFGTTEREDWENGTERDDFDGIRETPGASSAASSDDDDFEPQDRDAAGADAAGPPARAAARHAPVGRGRGRGAGADRVARTTTATSPTRWKRSPRGCAGDDDAEARDELLERLQCALKWLQSMEPTGVGARDLAECLTLQLRALRALRGADDRDHRLQAAPASCWRGAT